MSRDLHRLLALTHKPVVTGEERRPDDLAVTEGVAERIINITIAIGVVKRTPLYQLAS